MLLGTGFVCWTDRARLGRHPGIKCYEYLIAVLVWPVCLVWLAVFVYRYVRDRVQ